MHTSTGLREMIPDADLLLPKPWSNISLLRVQIINRKNLLRTIKSEEKEIKNIFDVQLKTRLHIEASPNLNFDLLFSSFIVYTCYFSIITGYFSIISTPKINVWCNEF